MKYLDAKELLGDLKEKVTYLDTLIQECEQIDEAEQKGYCVNISKVSITERIIELNEKIDL